MSITLFMFINPGIRRGTDSVKGTGRIPSLTFSIPIRVSGSLVNYSGPDILFQIISTTDVSGQTSVDHVRLSYPLLYPNCHPLRSLPLLIPVLIVLFRGVNLGV